MSSVINQDDILHCVRDKVNGNSIHGLSNSEIEEFRQLLSSVKPNDSASKTVFPDFVSENGFIEHFHVTSGPSSERKGYDITKAESKMGQSHKDFMHNVSDSLSEENCDRILMSHYSTAFLRQDDSLDNFRKSFMDHWKDHINHLHHYNGDKHISCFMISSDDILAIYEDMYDENGFCFGDLAGPDGNRVNFCLSYDCKLLDDIYKYKNEIDYVIYYNILRGYVEVLKVSNIPAIKRYLPNHRRELYSSPCSIEMMSTDAICIPSVNKGK